MRFPWKDENSPSAPAHLLDIHSKIDFEPWLNHGTLSRWSSAVMNAPDATIDEICLETHVGPRGLCPDPSALRQAAETLSPWRKGPYQLFDLVIDTEWRSDMKWNRVRPHLPVNIDRALDVGCGSGYHMWRLRELGAASVLGIDPSPLFACQFGLIQKYLRDENVEFWPIPLEAMPASQHFDLVLSMGVLYHRRSPIEHLTQLRDQCAPGGTVLLETLVVPGDINTVLMPEGRYARMRNCWFLPSVEALTVWCHRAGFESVRCVDVNQTGVDEQRSTSWCGPESLIDSLDPNDPDKTIEGLPAPLRASLILKKSA